MTFKDINKKFTETIAELMMDGYTMNAETMSGSQGETAHVDMTDGDEVVRVVVEDFYDGDSLFHRLEGTRIIVGRCTDRVRIDGKGAGNIVWNNHLEIISEERFYRLSQYGAWYGTLDEAIEARAKQRERSKRVDHYYGFGPRVEIDMTSEETIEVVLPVVRRRFGLQRVTRQDMKIVKRIYDDSVSYGVYYRGKYAAMA